MKKVVLTLCLSVSAFAQAQNIAPSCDFDKEQVVYAATYKVSEKKRFVDSREGYAMDQCRAQGYQQCVIQRHRDVVETHSGLAEGINMINPLAILTGIGFKEDGRKVIKGIVNGYNYAPKSQKKLKKELCPQLKVCSFTASGTAQVAINRISEKIGCEK